MASTDSTRSMNRGKAFRLFLNNEKKVIKMKYPFLSAKQLHNKAIEQWQIFCVHNDTFNQSSSKQKSKTRRKSRKKAEQQEEIREKRIHEVALKSPARGKWLVSPGSSGVYCLSEDEERPKATSFNRTETTYNTNKTKCTASDWNQTQLYDAHQKAKNYTTLEGTKDCKSIAYDWNVNMWQQGVSTRRTYGSQHRLPLFFKSKAPQIIEDDPRPSQQGILMNHKPEEEKKKVKCSVSFFETAVTHHYPAMSPETPSNHKVFTFSEEERARIQKVLKRSKEQDTPVIRVTSPTVSDVSEESTGSQDPILMQYRAAESVDFPTQSQESQDYRQDEVESIVSSQESNADVSVCQKPCTPLIRLGESPRTFLAGVTPALPVMSESDSPASSTSSDASDRAKLLLHSTEVSDEMKSHILSTPVKVCLVRVDEQKGKSPAKRKSPTSDTDNNDNVPSGSKVKKAVPVKSSPAMRRVDFSEISQESDSQDSSTVHTDTKSNSIQPEIDRNTNYYKTLFGFASDNDSLEANDLKSSPRKPSSRTSPRKGKMTDDSSNSYQVFNVKVDTPLSLTDGMSRTRTPFRMLSFHSEETLTPMRKPPAGPSSVKKILGIRDGGITKHSSRKKLAASLSYNIASMPSLTASRSSERLLAKARRNSFNEGSDTENMEVPTNSESENAKHRVAPDTLNGSIVSLSQGSSIKTSPTHSKTLSRSTGQTSLTQDTETGNVLTLSRSSRSLHRSPKRAVNSSHQHRSGSPQRVAQSPQRFGRSPQRRVTQSPCRKAEESQRRVAQSPRRRVAESPSRPADYPQSVVQSPRRRDSESPVRVIENHKRIGDSPRRRVAESPRRIAESPRRRVAESPQRAVPSSPRLPVRSSPRKSRSLSGVDQPLCLTAAEIDLNSGLSTSDEDSNSGPCQKQSSLSKTTLEDTVRKMRETVSHQPATSTIADFLAATRTPSEASQLSDVSSTASLDDDASSVHSSHSSGYQEVNLQKLHNLPRGRKFNPSAKYDPPSASSFLSYRSNAKTHSPPSRSPSPKKNCSPVKLHSRKNMTKPPSPVRSQLNQSPKMIITKDREYLQLGDSAEQVLDMMQKQRENFLCNLFVDLTPPSKQRSRDTSGRRFLKSKVVKSESNFNQFFKGDDDKSIFL